MTDVRCCEADTRQCAAGAGDGMTRTVSRRRVRAAVVMMFALSIGVTPAAAGQAPAAGNEPAAVGAVVGAGWPGSLAALRVSLPAWSRADLDVDAGHIGWSSSLSSSLFVSLQVRILHAARSAAARTRGFIVGVNVADGGVAPAVGYGLDLLATRRLRVGAEFTTGGSPNAGPRVLAKLYVVGRPAVR